MKESEGLLILNAIPGLGSVRIRKLLEHYGSAEKIFYLKAQDFGSDLIPTDVAENIASFPKEEFLQKECDFLKKKEICVVSFQEDDYPKTLLEVSDFPVVLYVKGDVKKLNSLNFAIVGSRQASLYGTTMARQFAQRLAELGWTIVSGMARGIDTNAHEGALSTAGSTIAVLGCGLNYVYPAENEELLERIAQNGAVVSEFPMNVAPIAHNFPRRNRIISGLSAGVLVVEAALKSGALITADCALEQGREVFAMPGKIDNPYAQGVHNLIKQGAKLVTSVEDILEELKVPIQGYLKKERGLEKQTAEPINLPEDELRIYNYVNDRPIHMDELSERCGVMISSVGSLLFRLELKKLVKQLPGKMFVRI